MPKKIFPLKLEDCTYANLKYVSEQTNRPMAAIVRGYFEKTVNQQAVKLKKKQAKKITLTEFAKKYANKITWYHQNKTDDELLYEGSHD